ncbi:MAG: [Fe-Fe] hydrogenase large subunit C-terminal domain-containing protein, partial [Erysipelotrichaceae bacterium]
MNIITLKESNCTSCLKCVRNCPTKSISFENNQPEIIESECLSCGRCFLICPQSAKEVKNDKTMINNWIRNGEKVVISVAPSYQVVWPNFSKLKQGLEELGFYAVEETANGAAIVTKEYEHLMQQHKMNNIIETCCPVIVKLIENKYPELISQLSPVASPMIVHARMLKAKYPEAKIVFLSPCIAKQSEALLKENSKYVDAVIAMPDMDEWLLDIDGYDELPIEDNIARIYPVSGGIIKTFEPQSNYKTLAIEGLERCEGALKSIISGHLKGYFIEMNACLGGCLGGPYLYAYRENEWLAQSRISKNELSPKLKYLDSDNNDLNTSMEYTNRYIEKKKFSEQEIYEVLCGIGKYNKAKEFNCGACGYETCRDKAISVLEGKSDPKLCLPYALEHAESISNLIIHHTPNGIIVLDDKLCVLEINPSAIELLNLQNFSVKGFNIEALLPNEEISSKLKILNEVDYITSEYEVYNKVLQHVLIPIKEQNAIVILLTDLTQDTRAKEKMRSLRK